MLYEKRTVSAVVLVVTSLMNPVVHAADDDGNKDGWEANFGLAYDSNIYRAPSDPYFDAAAGTPISPNVQSGLFVPLRVNGKFSNNSDTKNTLTGNVNVYLDKYLDSKYGNADNTRVTVKLGNEHVLRKKKSKEKKFYVGFKYKNNIDSYLDRDTGDEKVTTLGTDISDRYRYTQTGFEFDYKSKITKPQYSFSAEYYNRKYEKTVVTEYDYTYLKLGGEVKFRLAKPTKLRVSYDFYTKDYDHRLARDADGTLNVNGVTRELMYNEFNAKLRHRFSKAMLVNLDYQFKLRSDQHVGYYDYTKHKLRARVKYDIDNRQQLKLDMAYWTRDYPNAYAYDLVNQDEKKYRGAKSRLAYLYQWDKAKTIIAQLDHWNENTTDSRYQFDRSIIWAGLEWKF